jgi:hypothetical protein
LIPIDDKTGVETWVLSNSRRLWRLLTTGPLPANERHWKRCPTRMTTLRGNGWPANRLLFDCLVSLAGSELALKELLGLLVYRLRGWT